MMYKVLIKDQEIIVTQKDLDNLDVSFDKRRGIYQILNDDKAYRILSTGSTNQGKNQSLQINDINIDVKIMDALDQQVDSMGLSVIDDSRSNNINAPMPGLILDIMCQEGDEIEEGTSLLILEAMKMENVIKAAGSGVITKIHHSKGDAVEKGQLIIEIE